MSELHVIHIDMDAFFAAVEQRDKPHLKDQPVVVGGSSQSRGVVSTASYEARKFGIHSAMSIIEARRLCPDAVFLPVDMNKYKKVSVQLRRIFSRYTNLVEPLSIDEAFLDVQGQDAVEVARSLKAAIKGELLLTASVGVSYNKFLAKLGSDMDKPDGFTVITVDRAQELLPSLPVRKIWGIGPKSEIELNRLGLYTFADIATADVLLLQKVLGKRAHEVKLLARGIDQRPVEPNQAAKSFGEETTLNHDTGDQDILLHYLQDFAKALSERLQVPSIKAKTVTVKIKFDDFSECSRSKTTQDPGNTAEYIYTAASRLLETMIKEGHRVRLIGLQVSGFLMPDEPEQIWFDFLH